MLKDLRRIPSTKNRQRKAKRRGGFLDPLLDKKHIAEINKTHICFWCKKSLFVYAYNHRTGEILMSCKTDGCLGNASESRRTWDRKYKNLYAKKIDKKLCFDFKNLVWGRDPSRMWATPKRHF